MFNWFKKKQQEFKQPVVYRYFCFFCNSVQHGEYYTVKNMMLHPQYPATQGWGWHNVYVCMECYTGNNLECTKTGATT